MAREALRDSVRKRLPPKLQRAREEFEEEYLDGICEILVSAGEFDSVEQCRSEGVEEAKEVSREWAEEWPDEMAEFLR